MSIEAIASAAIGPRVVWAGSPKTLSLWLCTLLLSSECATTLNLGGDAGAQAMDLGADARAQAASGTMCPAPGGAGVRLPATTPGGCQALMVGRWRFCGGTTASMATTEFWNGPAGIEFADESGMLRFYVLRRADGGPLERSSSSSEQGTARFDYVVDHGGVYGSNATAFIGGVCGYFLSVDVASPLIAWEMFWFESGLFLAENTSPPEQIEYRFVREQ